MVTDKEVQDQIKGLQRTQADEVWCRTDIAKHVLGDISGVCVHQVALSEKKPKPKSLVEAARNRDAPSTNDMGCFDREAYLEALLGALEQKTSPQKKGAGKSIPDPL